MDQVKNGPERSRFMFIPATALLVAVLLLVLAPAAMCAPPVAKEKISSPRFIAYYFYTNKRCSSCTQIEQLAKEAVTTSFKDELTSGKLQWRGVNVEQEGNEHFIQDFELYSKSVVIAEYKDGKPVRWDNLKDVWQLFRDKPKFLDYVSGGIKTFMEKK